MRNRLTFLVLFLTLIAYPISADEIHMKDGSVIKGKIIEVSMETIKYAPKGKKKKIQTIQRGSEVKIVYDDGETVDLAAIPDTGTKTPVKEDKSEPAVDPTKKRLFIEIEGGWNGNAGIGARLDFRLISNLTVNGGAGYCKWGTHIRESLGLRYYWNYPYGFAFGTGAAYNQGKSTVENLEVTRGGLTSSTEAVNIKYNSITTLNISLLYSRKLMDSNKYYFEIGYSYQLQKESYSYTVLAGGRLTNSQKISIWTDSPGGIMFSFGIGF